MAWGYGLKNGRIDSRNLYVGNIDDGEYILVRNVDFGDMGPKRFEVSAAAVKKGGEIGLRIGAPDGTLIGKVKLKENGSDSKYAVNTAKVKNIKGVCDLYLVFRGNDTSDDLFRLDWWKFIR